MTALPKPKRERNEARLEFVRKMPCLVLMHGKTCATLYHISVADCHPERFCDAHHVRKGSHSGLRTKPNDFRTVPLCRFAHDEYHAIGHDAFCMNYGLDLEAHIFRINREFEKTQPKPRKEREKSPGLRSIVVQCESCGRKENIPAGKVTRYGAGLRYRCVRTNQLQSVTLK